MSSVIKVINRVFVIEFYKQNVAFFALIFFILFGFIRASEHLVIGYFLVSNPSTLIFLFMLWSTYSVKVVLFVLTTINKSENQFLGIFYFLPHTIKIISTLASSFSILLPIVAYTAFLLSLAFTHGFYLTSIILVLALLFIVGAISCLFYIRLSKFPREKAFFQFKLFKKAFIPSVLFFITYILRKEIVLLILTKLYTCALILGITILYRTDQFDLRLLSTGLLLAFIGNVTLVHKYIWFQYHQMAFLRNLPQSLFEIIARHLLTFIIILIPEYIFLFKHYPIEPKFYDIIGIAFFGLSITMLTYSLMLIKQIELSKFMITIFWVVILSTFMILFSIHPFVLAVLFLFISMTIIYYRHFQFEYSEAGPQ